MPSIVIMEDLDRFFTKTEEDNLINFEDKKTKLLYTLINEIENLWNINLALTQNGKNSDIIKNINNKILIISTCSNIDKIDIELKKPGNLDYIINFSPPIQQIRKKLFLHFSKHFNNNLSEEDFEILADKSHGFVPTDIIQIFK